MYTEVGTCSQDTIAALLALLPGITWQHCTREPGEVHSMAGCMELAKKIPELAERWPIEIWEQATLLLLEPGDHLFRHADKGVGDLNYHIPIETTPEAVSLSFENGVRTEHHLEVATIYHADRSIKHEAFNAGTTNRTHLLLTLKDL